MLAPFKPWEQIYDLKKIHTKVLMKWREKCYILRGGYDPTDCNGPVIPQEAIMAELATREHIPNKQEAKALRQQKAKK